MDHRRSRAMLLAVPAAVLGLVVLAIAGPSVAAKGSRTPTSATASASATVSGSTANLKTQVNRTASSVTSLTCTVGGSNVGCALSSSSRTGATYVATVSGLAPGSYTFSATYQLSDGGTAQASTTFYVSSPGSTTAQQSACARVTGVFSGDPNANWQCDYPAGAGDGVPDSGLLAACNGVAVWTVGGGSKRGGSTVFFGCA